MVDVFKVFTLLERGMQMVLNREDFFKRIHDRMPDATSDEDIGFLEDMTDTYNDLERKSKVDGIDWEQRAKDIDNAWREKYKHRFFNGGDRNIPINHNQQPDDDNSARTITVEDLFD